ncbi:MAG: sugar phosphate nucleotidyltransferase [Methanocorpusculum sp.]|uniref:sugar phosphate nucleotidyltransferase n=1 Tax=Methanocorpusculum sp. TaxID=2058474 RepID=UPI002722DE28|nr:sugar phosphate nucleotidyltransferase [Methanocorpusculum sp.]MDO9523666.1 sugar phosphate nucleotidyltransferase [Methanocorpusculum sp.]
MTKIQAVILAAGEGTRLRPLTKNRPKVMLPVANRPILEHVLNSVVAAGIRDITVVVGYKKEQVMTFLNTYPVPVQVVVQDKQLGTAHALSMAKKYVHTKTLVLAGDNYVDPESLRSILDKENAVLVAPHSSPANFGVISSNDGILTGIVEKPKDVEPGSLVSCGVYIFTPEFIGNIRERTIPESLEKSIKAGMKISIVSANDWQDAVYPKDLLSVNKNLLKQVREKISGTVDKSVTVQGHVSIAKHTVIGPGTVILGPAVIGEGSIVGPNVCIGPNTSIGSRVTIEPFTYIENSIIMNDCIIGSHSRVVDTILGEGGIYSNHLSTVSNEFGAVCGDRVNIGPFTVIKGGIIGNNVIIEGGKILEKEIPDNAQVI